MKPTLVAIVVAGTSLILPGHAAAVVRVRLVNAGDFDIASAAGAAGAADALLLGSHGSDDVVIDMAKVLGRAHARTGARPQRTPAFTRRLVRARRNFAHLVAGMVRCANVYVDHRFHVCDGAPAIALYNMLAATWSSDPHQPLALRMAALFEGPIRATGDGLHLAVNNPLLAPLGLRWVACAPVITDATNATCLLAFPAAPP